MAERPSEAWFVFDKRPASLAKSQIHIYYLCFHCFASVEMLALWVTVFQTQFENNTAENVTNDYTSKL